MTGRELELATVLCQAVRLLSLEQIAREWWPPNRDARWRARADVNRMSQAKWLLPIQVLARPLLELTAPLLEWTPEEVEPDFAVLERRCQERWTAAAIVTEVVIADRRAIATFGGSIPSGLKNPCQTTHDLHLTEIFLRYRRAGLNWRERWIGEDEIAARWQWKKLPDAVLCDTDGQPLKAVDFGGAYRAERLQDFHESCAARSLPYELW